MRYSGGSSNNSPPTRVVLDVSGAGPVAELIRHLEILPLLMEALHSVRAAVSLGSGARLPLILCVLRAAPSSCAEPGLDGHGVSHRGADI